MIGSWRPSARKPTEPDGVTEVLRGLSAEGLVTPSANGPWHTGPRCGASGRRTGPGRTPDLDRCRVDAQSAPDRRLLALMALAALGGPGLIPGRGHRT